MIEAKISGKLLQSFKSNAYFSVQMSIMMLTRSDADVSLRVENKTHERRRKTTIVSALLISGLCQ